MKINGLSDIEFCTHHFTLTDEVVKSFETLRNNLAHSQDIVAFDWDTIVGLANNLERVIELLNNGVN